jgi:hypothetical protein
MKYSPLWIIKCYCNKETLVWKGKDNLSPLGKKCENGMGIREHHECSTPQWDFA